MLTGILLVCLSVLGAFEPPTVQACVPQMQSGDKIIKGNAVVNQVAAVAALIAPILGSVLYTVFGLKLVLYAGVLCFFVTAALECFIVRNVLGLNAEYYGFAESALGFVAIIGSIAAGLLTEKMKPGKLSIPPKAEKAEPKKAKGKAKKKSSDLEL